MKYILVHGAWHGGWLWDRLRPLLEAAGHEVYTPTLTGLGDKADQLTPDIGLEDHVNDIQQLIENEALYDVVLVAHSYAGIVATIVADRMPEKIHRLIYLDSLVPRAGQSAADCFPAEFQQMVEKLVDEQGDGWKMPVLNIYNNFGLQKQEDIDFVMPKLVMHPFKTLKDVVELNRPVGASVPTSFISCISDAEAERKRDPFAEGINDYHELVAGHDAMVSVPNEVYGLLQKISATG